MNNRKVLNTFFACSLLCACLPQAGFATSLQASEINEIRQSKINVSGTVVDEKGEPIIGASVLQKGTQTGAVTDLDGKFKLSVAAGSELVISYIGYVTQTVKITDNSTPPPAHCVSRRQHPAR